MGNVFAYTRVSTVKQGEKGVSLQEQKDAILRYAQQHGLEVVRWFEERESAAKTLSARFLLCPGYVGEGDCGPGYTPVGLVDQWIHRDGYRNLVNALHRHAGVAIADRK